MRPTEKAQCRGMRKSTGRDSGEEKYRIKGRMKKNRELKEMSSHLETGEKISKGTNGELKGNHQQKEKAIS